MTTVPIRRLLFFVLICLVAAPLVIKATTADAFFDSSLGDFSGELKIAQQQGKQGVLLVFEAEGCPFCRRMREKVLSQVPVQQYFHRHFNIFAVDFNGSVTVTDFTGNDLAEKMFVRTQRVRGTPTFLFVGVDGKEMARYTGATRDVAEFMALGRYVTEGHFGKMSFEQYYSSGRQIP